MLTVVKVGGSYAHYPGLADLVSALAQGGGRAVIVPGGGPFADCVRREQPRIGFDDRAAHRMALYAMAAYGAALASFSRHLVPAGSTEAVRAALDAGSVPVWLPLELTQGRSGIPESWEMTSDSLAAWLAGRVAAERLIFLKRKAPPGPALLADLVGAGVLDPLVPHFLADCRVEPWLCGPRDIRRLGAALAAGSPVGRRIALA